MDGETSILKYIHMYVGVYPLLPGSILQCATEEMIVDSEVLLSIERILCQVRSIGGWPPRLGE